MPKTILIVDDDLLNLDILSRRMMREGFRVVTAGDGPAAIRKALAEKPDLILMDFSLPIMDGWAATRKIKDEAATQHIPVIGLTAHIQVGNRDEAIKAGCDEYEAKPIDFARLLMKIKALIARSDAG